MAKRPSLVCDTALKGEPTVYVRAGAPAAEMTASVPGEGATPGSPREPRESTMTSPWSRRATASTRSPFDMPADIMSKQFSRLGRSPAQQPAPQYKAPAPQGGLIMMVGSRQVMIPDLDDEEDCSKDLNQYISQIDELMGNYL